MAGGATFGKQLWRRFALIEILRNSHRSAERDYRRKNKQTAARFHWRHQFFRYTERISRLGKKGGRWQVKRNLLSMRGEKWVRFRHYCVPIGAWSTRR